MTSQAPTIRLLSWTLTFSIFIIAVFLANSSVLSLDIVNIGEPCTVGELECQENEQRECVCEEYSEFDFDTDEEILRTIVCGWHDTGNSCGEEITGEAPECDESRRGATHRFPANDIKECYCIETDSGDIESCFWD